METHHPKGQNSELQSKKDNSLNAKNSSNNDDKQTKNQDHQPQWKMGAPTRGAYSNSADVNGLYGQYNDVGYSKGGDAMGGMPYMYDYMSWGYGYPYQSKYYDDTQRPYQSKRRNEDFGYYQAPPHRRNKMKYVPVATGKVGDNTQEQNNDESGNKRINSFNFKCINDSEGQDANIKTPSAAIVKGAGDQKNLENAKFFVIKSYSEEDVYKAVKFNLWCSTPTGNQKLHNAFVTANGEYPIFLLFSINGSGHFVGICQMTSTVDFNRNFDGWNQNHKWRGCFEISWIYIKDISNKELRHLKNDMNEGKPVTNSRDTQEVPTDVGVAMLELFEKFENETSILDDFEFFESERRKF